MHRPKYDDWSFPKGKLDPGEHVTSAAVREVAEETGLDIRLGPPLTVAALRGRATADPCDKLVHYWAGRVVGGDDVSTYQPNDEIDEVAWVHVDKAAEQLTYRARPRDARRGPSAPQEEPPAGRAAPRQGGARKTWRRRRPRAAARRRRRAAGRAGRPDPRGVRRPPGAQLEQPPLLDDGRPVRRRGRRRPRGDARPVRGGRQPRGPSRGTCTGCSAQAEPAVLCTHRPVLPHVYDALGVRDPRPRRPARCSSCTTAAARSSRVEQHHAL